MKCEANKKNYDAMISQNYQSIVSANDERNSSKKYSKFDELKGKLDPISLQEKMKTFKFAKVEKGSINQAESNSA